MRLIKNFNFVLSVFGTMATPHLGLPQTLISTSLDWETTLSFKPPLSLTALEEADITDIFKKVDQILDPLLQNLRTLNTQSYFSLEQNSPLNALFKVDATSILDKIKINLDQRTSSFGKIENSDDPNVWQTDPGLSTLKTLLSPFGIGWGWALHKIMSYDLEVNEQTARFDNADRDVLVLQCLYQHASFFPVEEPSLATQYTNDYKLTALEIASAAQNSKITHQYQRQYFDFKRVGSAYDLSFRDQLLDLLKTAQQLVEQKALATSIFQTPVRPEVPLTNHQISTLLARCLDDAFVCAQITCSLMKQKKWIVSFEVEEPNNKETIRSLSLYKKDLIQYNQFLKIFDFPYQLTSLSALWVNNLDFRTGRPYLDVFTRNFSELGRLQNPQIAPAFQKVIERSYRYLQAPLSSSERNPCELQHSIRCLKMEILLEILTRLGTDASNSATRTLIFDEEQCKILNSSPYASEIPAGWHTVIETIQHHYQEQKRYLHQLTLGDCQLYVSHNEPNLNEHFDGEFNGSCFIVNANPLKQFNSRACIRRFFNQAKILSGDSENDWIGDESCHAAFQNLVQYNDLLNGNPFLVLPYSLDSSISNGPHFQNSHELMEVLSKKEPLENSILYQPLNPFWSPVLCAKTIGHPSGHLFGIRVNPSSRSDSSYSTLNWLHHALYWERVTGIFCPHVAANDRASDWKYPIRKDPSKIERPSKIRSILDWFVTH